MSETATEEARAADAIEAAAYREMYAAAPPELGARLGLETHEIGGATLLVARGIPDPFFNRTIGLGLARPAREEDVDAMLAAYRAVKSWWLHLTPGAAPAALVSWLEARGFALAKRRAWAKMLRGTEASPEGATPGLARARGARRGRATHLHRDRRAGGR